MKDCFTLLHPGVKAPGTAKMTPFLPLNRSAMFTFSPGLFSYTSTDGNASPTFVEIKSLLPQVDDHSILIRMGSLWSYFRVRFSWKQKCEGGFSLSAKITLQQWYISQKHPTFDFIDSKQAETNFSCYRCVRWIGKQNSNKLAD